MKIKLPIKNSLVSQSDPSMESGGLIEYDANTEADDLSDEETAELARNALRNYFVFQQEYELIVFGNDVRFAHTYTDDNGDHKPSSSRKRMLSRMSGRTGSPLLKS